MNKKQIAVIGSGIIRKKEIRNLTENLGEKLIDNDFRIICGGKKGVMEAVCKGARRSKKYKEGLIVGILPSLERLDANPYVDIVITTGMSYARNQIIVSSADAVIAIQGGAGTLSEISFAWQYDKPIIVLKNTGGWAEKLTEVRLDERKREPIIGANNVEEIITYLKNTFKT